MLASIAYRQASIEEREKYSNGCGPYWFPRKLRDFFSKVFGNSVREACAIHDWDYGHKYNKKVSDLRLLANLKLLAIEAASDRRMLVARICAAYVYYWAVKLFG